MFQATHTGVINDDEDSNLDLTSNRGDQPVVSVSAALIPVVCD